MKFDWNKSALEPHSFTNINHNIRMPEALERKGMHIAGLTESLQKEGTAHQALTHTLGKMRFGRN